MMIGRTLFLFVAVVLFSASGCRKCVDCEMRLKQSQDVIGYRELCGTNKKVDEEQEQLSEEFYCVECTVNTGMGTTSSGIECGERAFVDSVERAWRDGGLAIGTTANCTFYRDTVNVRCTLVVD